MVNVRRIVKALLLSLVAIVALIVLALGGLWAYAAIDKEDTFFLQNAEFDDANYLRRIESLEGDNGRILRRACVPVYALRLKRGSGTIFAYRFYSNGDLGIIDDEDYRKVTVWIAGAIPRTAVDLPLGDASKCLLVFGPAVQRGRGRMLRLWHFGTVRVEPAGRFFRITILGEVTPAGNAMLGRT